MGIFSKSCEYALRAVFYIASQSSYDKKVGIKEIAENINSPEAFLAKLLQQLTKANLVQSMKGPNGGFYMREEDLNKTLSTIVEIIDGDSIFNGCGLGLTYCSESNPCPLHDSFKHVRNELTRMLKNTKIQDFNEELLKGNTTLNK